MPTTNPHPDIPLPSGAEYVGPWDCDGYRDISGPDRAVTDHKVRVNTLCLQASDGTVSELWVRCYERDAEPEELVLNSDQARELSAALLSAADELDGWALR
ncbi:hypothetical protein [Mycobacterium marinum]|uniref:hypothetical protein n=1 Tax=Mycobacterium marinum TaxID=1781 RepID=UPI002359E0E7|nr:hypothetical protein [Mycobacterium marinum]MDC9015132.1 hypothetical protein [Mycobacterium marinum]